VQRIFGTYYYSAFFGVFLIIWIFKTVIYNFLIKSCFADDEKTTIVAVKMEASEMTGDFMQTTFSQKSLCDSYKIENNPDYVEVLEIMKKKKKFVVKVKNI
jgi:hypothetical protein